MKNDYTPYDPHEHAPVSDIFAGMINKAMRKGKALFVDNSGDVWELDQNYSPVEYCGRVQSRAKQVSEYMDAQELADMIRVSQSKAYCFIRQMNDELKAKGYFIIRGKVPRKYARERFGVSE